MLGKPMKDCLMRSSTNYSGKETKNHEICLIIQQQTFRGSIGAEISDFNIDIPTSCHRMYMNVI